MYGYESWELDALEPTVLSGLVNAEVQGLLDGAAWRREEARERTAKRELGAIADRYEEVARHAMAMQADDGAVPDDEDEDGESDDTE